MNRRAKGRTMALAKPGWLSVLLLVAAACQPAADPSTSSGMGEVGDTCRSTTPGLAHAFEQIDTLLARRLEAEAIPGIAAGVVCGGELAWSQGYGVMALHDARPVTSHTRFRVASITKVFTATAIMKLKDDGALALDDPARRHVAWFEMRRPPGIGEAPVTIKHLLTHTSGVPRDSRLTDFRRLFQPTRAEAIRVLPSQSLQTPPGETTAYSNLGYGVLGEIIAETSGMSYPAYLEQKIFTPLGMTASLVHPTRDDDVAWGHGPRPRTGGRRRAGFWDLGFATPAGGMASSVEDLSKFVILHLAPHVGTQSAVLSPSTVQEMHEIHYMVDPDRGGVGLGWAVEISHGQHLVYHGGELPEQTSFMLIDLGAHIGVIVLTNAEGVDANGMAQEILRVVRTAVAPGTAIPARAIPPG